MQSDHDRKFHLDLDQRRAVRLLPKIEERVRLLARSLLHFGAKKARRNARHLQKLSVKYQISEFAHKTIVHGLP
jgi:hypothetical protein